MLVKFHFYRLQLLLNKTYCIVLFTIYTPVIPATHKAFQIQEQNSTIAGNKCYT